MAVFAGLPERQRQVVALRVFLDLDTVATAQALGIAPGTVTAHMARATAALRASAHPSWPTGGLAVTDNELLDELRPPSARDPGDAGRSLGTPVESAPRRRRPAPARRGRMRLARVHR